LSQQCLSERPRKRRGVGGVEEWRRRSLKMQRTVVFFIMFMRDVLQ
jgi:hypothetical protein